MLETLSDYCPYCGEPIELVVDCSVPEQCYIEDCPVCCHPMAVSVNTMGTDVELVLRRDDEVF